jgi:cytochrome c peroxidase
MRMRIVCSRSEVQVRVDRVKIRACMLLLTATGVAAGVSRQQEPITPLPTPVQIHSQRAAIGERLFNDVRVSRNSTHSCATCHPLDRGGMDGLAVAVRSDGTLHHRNTPTIFNASLNATFNWDGVASTLPDHTDRVLATLMETTWSVLLDRLRADRAYAAAFGAAYPEGVTRANVLHAFTTFEQSLVTPRSRFDRYLLGEQDAMTPREKDGYRLFKSYGCVSCHQGINIGGNMYQRFGVFEDVALTRPGMIDLGRYLITKVDRDRHVFRVPSLRNVAVTAPYFHDGRARTLETAVRTMGRAQLGRHLTTNEISSIVGFLRALTGEYRGRPLHAPGPEAR